MLSHDDDGSADPGRAINPCPAADVGDQPTPTGLIDQPVLPRWPAPPSAAEAGRSPRRWSSSRSWAAARCSCPATRSAGTAASRRPAKSSEADAWKPFWTSTPSSATRYPLEPVERNDAHRGRHPGHGRVGRRPVLVVPQPGGLPGHAQRHLGHVRGHRRGDRLGRRRRERCATAPRSGPNCHLVVIAPLDGSPAEAAGLRPGDVILRSTARRSTA